MKSKLKLIALLPLICFGSMTFAQTTPPEPPQPPTPAAPTSPAEPVGPDTIVINMDGMKITIEVNDISGLENVEELDLDELIEQIVAQSMMAREVPEFNMAFRFNDDSIAVIHGEDMNYWHEGMKEWQEEMMELREELLEDGFEVSEIEDSLGNKKFVINMDGFEYEYPATPNPNWFEFHYPGHPSMHGRHHGEEGQNLFEHEEGTEFDWEAHHNEILERIHGKFRLDDEDDEEDDKREFGQTYDFFQVRLGFSNYLNSANQLPAEGDDNYALNAWKSNILSFGTAFKTRMAGPLYLKYGLEIAFQDYFLEGDYTFENMDGNTVFLPIDENEISNLEKSKLKTTTLNIPLMLMLDAGDPEDEDAFTLGFGGYAGYVIGSRTKVKFESSNGNTEKIKDKGGFNLNEFQYGLQAQIGVKGVNLFMRYAISDFFDQGNGPQLNGMSFGVVF